MENKYELILKNIAKMGEHEEFKKILAVMQCLFKEKVSGESNGLTIKDMQEMLKASGTSVKKYLLPLQLIGIVDVEKSIVKNYIKSNYYITDLGLEIVRDLNK